MVGGRALSGSLDDNPSRLATYGEQEGSAVETGQQIMQDAEDGIARVEKTGLAGVPPFQFPFAQRIIWE